MPVRDAKNQKAFADDRSYVPSEVSHVNRIGHAGDDDLELSQVISELESLAKSSAERKAKIIAGFGSLENVLAYILTTPELRKIYEDELRANLEFRDRCQDVLRKRLAQLIAQIGDVPSWTALATSDPKEFRVS